MTITESFDRLRQRRDHLAVQKNLGQQDETEREALTVVLDYFSNTERLKGQRLDYIQALQEFS